MLAGDQEDSMATKTYCDVCGNETSANHTRTGYAVSYHDREARRNVHLFLHVALEIHAPGDICRTCMLKALTEGTEVHPDRRAEFERIKEGARAGSQGTPFHIPDEVARL